MPSLQFAEGVEPWTDPSSKKQLLNHLVDGKARTRPEAVWAKVPKDPTTYDAGYRKITYLAFANAVNGIASWILQHLGRSSTFETIAYFGVWDPRYIIVTLGAVKAGYKVRDFTQSGHLPLDIEVFSANSPVNQKVVRGSYLYLVPDIC